MDLGIIAPVLADLRTEIVWSANACLGQLHGTAEHLGHAEVAKLEQASSRHEDILGLDVPLQSRCTDMCLDSRVTSEQ